MFEQIFLFLRIGAELEYKPPFVNRSGVVKNLSRHSWLQYRSGFFKIGIVGAIQDDPYVSHIWLQFLEYQVTPLCYVSIKKRRINIISLNLLQYYLIRTSKLRPVRENPQNLAVRRRSGCYKRVEWLVICRVYKLSLRCCDELECALP